MGRLKGVIVGRGPNGTSIAVRGDMVEDFQPGPSGRVIVLAGPGFSGNVFEAHGQPLEALGRACPNPSDRSPAQLARREELGRHLVELAAVVDPQDQEPAEQ